MRLGILILLLFCCLKSSAQNQRQFWALNGGKVEQLFLQRNPGAIAAYSLRGLSSAYIGPRIRVRRLVDNLEIDIYGAAHGGTINTTTLDSFCLLTTCTVTKWYDQSGRGQDIVQATTANQPGINDTETTWNGATTSLVCSAFGTGFTYTGNGSSYMVIRSDDSNITAGNIIGTVFDQSTTGSANNFIFAMTRSSLSGIKGASFEDATGWFYGKSSKVISTYYVVSFLWQNLSTYFTNGNTSIYFNNIANTPYQMTASTNPPTLGTGRLIVGAYSTGAFAGYHFNGKIKELILYNTTTTPNIIDTSLNNYYHIF